MANSEAVGYGRAVARRLQNLLRKDLRGAYLSGSVALGGYVPGQSDIDLFAVWMDYHLSFDPASEPSHWFVLDISIVGEYGLRLVGTPAREVFAPIPRPWVLEALEDSLGWHADHETLLHYSVLNACRSRHYAEEAVMSSKDEAAAWESAHAEDPSIIDSALAIRRGDRSRSLRRR